MKSDELTGKVDRLQNGLEKLRSTAEQVVVNVNQKTTRKRNSNESFFFVFLKVDALKEKLAVQEVELKIKNEAADALIEIVGVETEKCSKEKSIADEEEKKVALIASEVSKKQKDCEADLVKAEPALLAAQEALNTLNKVLLIEAHCRQI